MLPLLLAAAVLAQVPKENGFLHLKSASYVTESARFVAEGTLTGLPPEVVLAGSLTFGDAAPVWTRAAPADGAFRLEFYAQGQEVLPGRYAARVTIRPDDQDPAILPLPQGADDVGIEVVVGTPEAAKEALARLAKEDLGRVEELRGLLAALGQAALAARQAKSLEPLKAKAFPEGEVWKGFLKLRDAQGERDRKLFLHPAGVQQRAISALFGTWEKWFLTVWEETANYVHAPIPKEVVEIGVGGLPDRAIVEEELKRVVGEVYKALGGKPAEWKSGLPKLGEKPRVK